MANDDEEPQQSLRNWQDDAKSRPILHKDTQVGPIHVKSKGNIFPGYRGWVPARESYGFVQFCERQKHYHRNEQAYMLSDKVLAYLRAKGCKTILIAEDDTGTVYEFHISEFNESVPQKAKGKNEKDEAQSMVRVSENWGQYADHADYVMVGSREVN